MPLDDVDKGQVSQETDDMRQTSEKNIANAPPAEFFYALR